MSSSGDDDYLYDEDDDNTDSGNAGSSDDDDDGIGMDLESDIPSSSHLGSTSLDRSGSERQHDEEYHYEVLTTEQIVEHMVESIKEVNNVIQVSSQ